MSELLLVRHGQATPFEQDTDQLSALGAEQARAVGDFLKDVQPTHMLHGSLVRQQRTAQLVAEGLDWPSPTLDARLNEFDGDGLMRTLAPLLQAQDAGFARLVAAFQENRRGPDRNRHFQRLLESLAAAWQADSVTHADVEGWAVFKTRVLNALKDIMSLPSGSTVVACTSGGVIGLIVATALEAPDRTALQLNWRVKNASLTRLTFGRSRLSLDSFNELGHLPTALRSWR